MLREVYSPEGYAGYNIMLERPRRRSLDDPTRDNQPQRRDGRGRPLPRHNKSLAAALRCYTAENRTEDDIRSTLRVRARCTGRRDPWTGTHLRHKRW